MQERGGGSVAVAVARRIGPGPRPLRPPLLQVSVCVYVLVCVRACVRRTASWERFVCARVLGGRSSSSTPASCAVKHRLPAAG